MPATIVERTESTVTIQISIPLTRSMLETEDGIQKALNEAGVRATGEALKQFDTDGSPMEFGATRWTTKGQEPKTYQTPDGEVVVGRHVYQQSTGGTTFCPLERDARIILTATPRFAMQISHQYGEGPAGRAVKDFRDNHRREVSLALVQDTAAAVAAVAQAKEEQWHYATPKLTMPISTIGIGLDGTCLFMTEEGNRQAMVGTISLYAKDGERHHTIYIAATPEYGKATFYQRLDREIAHVKGLYPDAQWTGVADGSHDNWTFLNKYTEDACIDFYHATTYVHGAARAVHPRSVMARVEWVDEACHKLKHEKGYARTLLGQLQELPTEGLSEMAREDLRKAITYFRNHHPQMNYAERVEANLPIGSGVTEAACKTIVKIRMCRGGAQWKEPGAAGVLSLRTLLYTEGRWEQFWAKVDRYGFPVAIAA
jgi:hypothetical protein